MGVETRVGVFITGEAGDFLGAFNAGALILIRRGSANDYPGYAMYGGEVGVVGSVGRAAGAYLSGGRILVWGSAGPYAGLRMRGGAVVVKGDAGEGAACGQAGGEIALLGKCAGTVGAGMVGGVAFVRKETAVDLSAARTEPLDAAAATRLRELASWVKAAGVNTADFVRVVPAAVKSPPGAAPRAPGAPDEAKAFVDSFVSRVEEDDDG